MNPRPANRIENSSRFDSTPEEPSHVLLHGSTGLNANSISSHQNHAKSILNDELLLQSAAKSPRKVSDGFKSPEKVCRALKGDQSPCKSNPKDQIKHLESRILRGDKASSKISVPFFADELDSRVSKDRRSDPDDQIRPSNFWQQEKFDLPSLNACHQMGYLEKPSTFLSKMSPENVILREDRSLLSASTAN